LSSTTSVPNKNARRTPHTYSTGVLWCAQSCTVFLS
jgi:hypothetical protein